MNPKTFIQVLRFIAYDRVNDKPKVFTNPAHQFADSKLFILAP